MLLFKWRSCIQSIKLKITPHISRSKGYNDDKHKNKNWILKICYDASDLIWHLGQQPIILKER